MQYPGLRLIVSAALLLSAPVLQAQAPAPQTTLINRDASVYSEATGKIYLVDTAHDALSVIASDKSSSTLKVGAHPIDVALNHRTGILYAVNSGSRSVSILDTRTNTIVATLPTAARPYAIAVDEAANKVYVSNIFSNMLTVIDGASNTVSNLRVGSYDAILVDPARQRVYLLSYESETLTSLDPATGATTKFPAGALHLWGLAIAGKTLYVSHVQDSNIAAIDLETQTLNTLETGKMPCAIAISPTTGQVYVANFADGTVTILDKSNPPATIKVSPRPQALTLDDAAGLLYVASPQSNTVTVIDTKKRRVRETHNDPDHPYAVAVNPSTHAAYAINIADRPFTPLDRP